MSRMFEWKNPYVPGSPRARVAESKRQEVRKEREKKVRCEAAVQQILRSPAERESAELDIELLQVEQQQRVLEDRQALLDQERIDLKHAREKVEKEQAQIQGARERFEDKASSYRLHQSETNSEGASLFALQTRLETERALLLEERRSLDMTVVMLSDARIRKQMSTIVPPENWHVNEPEPRGTTNPASSVYDQRSSTSLHDTPAADGMVPTSTPSSALLGFEAAARSSQPSPSSSCNPAPAISVTLPTYKNANSREASPIGSPWDESHSVSTTKESSHVPPPDTRDYAFAEHTMPEWQRELNHSTVKGTTHLPDVSLFSTTSATPAAESASSLPEHLTQESASWQPGYTEAHTHAAAPATTGTGIKSLSDLQGVVEEAARAEVRSLISGALFPTRNSMSTSMAENHLKKAIASLEDDEQYSPFTREVYRRWMVLQNEEQEKTKQSQLSTQHTGMPFATSQERRATSPAPRTGSPVRWARDARRGQ